MELLSYLLQSSLCLGVFVGLYALLLRHETFYAAARGYFGLALVISLGLPLVEVPAWPADEAPGTERPTARYLPDLSFQFDHRTEMAPVSSTPDDVPGWSLEGVLLLGYGLGVGALALRMGYQFASLARLRRRARPVWVQGQRVWAYPTDRRSPSRFLTGFFWTRPGTQKPNSTKSSGTSGCTSGRGIRSMCWLPNC